MGHNSDLVLSDKTGKAIASAILQGASIIADKLSGITPDNQAIVYGFHVDSNESDPRTAVTYLKNAVGMTPAQMNFANNTFNYGSWKDAFFMPRPCMLKYDGTVDYYLDENDYEKKENGTVSALGDEALNYGVKYPGNAMMEWGRNNRKIWTKVVPDKNNPYSGSVYIANIQIDENYTAYPFISNQGHLVDHFYTAIYTGSITAFTGDDENVYYRLRSIPRRIPINALGTGNSKNQYLIPWEDDSTGEANGFTYLTQVKHEYRLALNNNIGLHDYGYSALYIHPTSADNSINNVPNLSNFISSYYSRNNVGWFTEVFCDIQLINNLLVLIGKSLNTQDVFGNGNIYGYDIYELNNGILYTGSSEYVNGEPNYDILNKSGLFWGTSAKANAIKVFGMENWWGNQSRRYAGHINQATGGTTQNHVIKNTFGEEDGSNVGMYYITGENYINTGLDIPKVNYDRNGYIRAMKFIDSITFNDKTIRISAILPAEIVPGNPGTIYWCDYFNSAPGSSYYSYRGGSSQNSPYLIFGAFFTGMGTVNYSKSKYICAALSYKPITPHTIIEK